MVLNEIASETLIVYKAWGNTSWEFKIDLLSKHYLWSPLGKLYDAGVIPLGLPSRRIKVVSSGGSGTGSSGSITRSGIPRERRARWGSARWSRITDGSQGLRSPWKHRAPPRIIYLRSYFAKTKCFSLIQSTPPFGINSINYGYCLKLGMSEELSCCAQFANGLNHVPFPGSRYRSKS